MFGADILKIIVSSKLKAKVILGSVLILVFSVITTGLFYFINKESAIGASVNNNDAITVIIDAGHGGIDGGTQASDGTLEKDINLKIALKLRDILDSFGVKTVMTRETDISIHNNGVSGIKNQKISDINNRLEIIESTENAVFVSIHQNYFTQSKYSGAQIFYSKNNPDSNLLALSIRKSIIENLQKDNTREIKASGKEIYLLNNATAPAVMVECGFLSNEAEAELLKSDEYQQQMAFFIALGILDYINSAEGS